MTFLTSVKKLREENPILATLLLYTIVLFHFCLVLFLFIGVFISDNILIIMSIIIVETFILLQWHVYGECILTPIENALSRKASNISFMSDFLNSVISKTGTDVFWTLKPPVIIIACLYKIYYLKTTCKRH